METNIRAEMVDNYWYYIQDFILMFLCSYFYIFTFYCNCIGKFASDRVLFLGSLNPSEYLLLLSIGDVMIDPYPFGGGVS